MTLNEMIYKRKSCRSFTNVSVDTAMIETVKAFPMKPLYPEIKVHWDVVPRNQVKCICPWTTPQLITIYAEETFRFFKTENAPVVPGYSYIGSVTL